MDKETKSTAEATLNKAVYECANSIARGCPYKEAMGYSQAALNCANALMTLSNIKSEKDD